jgi:hypothetical protein
MSRDISLSDSEARKCKETGTFRTRSRRYVCNLNEGEVEMFFSLFAYPSEHFIYWDADKCMVSEVKDEQDSILFIFI